MEHQPMTDIAWPTKIEAKSLSRQHSVEDNIEGDKSKRVYRRCWGITCYTGSILCVALSTLLLLLLLALLTSLIMLIMCKNTSTTTPISTIMPTKTTPIVSTTTTSFISTTTTPFISTTTTAESTTTTALICGTSCLNQSWAAPSAALAFWAFDGSYADASNTYTLIPFPNLPTFVTGYTNQAASFDASLQQALYTSYIPLKNSSFTIHAWIKPTGYPNVKDHSIVGLCPSKIMNKCLHINIRDKKLYFGFYWDDIQGRTVIPLNQWMHVAFTFDLTTKLQTIYLNGIPDAKNVASNALQISSGNFTIGSNEGVEYPRNYFQGYIDQLTVLPRTKASCEILESATLAAHFEFNAASPYSDSGPNSVSTSASGTSIVNGYKNEAVSFSGSSTAYFQAWGFISFGISNKAFSVAFWIQPERLSGSLVHSSTSPLGTGSRCFSLLGFAANGAIVAQIVTDANTIVEAIGPILPISSAWIPIVQTWSGTNGLKLYVNNTLVSSAPAATFFASETAPNYLTLGNCLDGCGDGCTRGSVDTTSRFRGAIDDWRIYSRELTSEDVCALFLNV